MTTSKLTQMIDCYREQYGTATEELFLGLSQPAQKIALLNPFLSLEDLSDITKQGQAELFGAASFYRLPKDLAPRPINGLLSHYFLDRSSIMAPLFLPLSPGMQVLDMCAAPGGKLLVMMARGLENVSFTANDLSRVRIERLRRVLKSYVPEPILRARAQLTTRDGNFFGLKRPGAFDAVLLDAPCSSEGHVIRNPHLLEAFKVLNKSLIYRQYSLLCAALLALKPGAFVMYSTCTINKNENEGVIKKLLAKKSALYEVVELSLPLGQKSDYGVNIHPHRDGCGPAFLSLIRKKAS